MDQEKWEELLRLRAKASFSPKSGTRFQQLENYLSDIHAVARFSEKELQRFKPQLDELSEEERQDLYYRATNKTSPSFFHLTYDEKEILLAARKELAFHERAQLFGNLILAAAGTVLLDLGAVFEGEIEIDDVSSPDRWTRPYARISFPFEDEQKIETVDILESVRSNPASIGHPVIAFAIHHWQRVIHAKRVIERDEDTFRDDEWRKIKMEYSGGREVEVAERNLEAIGKLLRTGANKRAIPKELALALKVESLSLRLEDMHTVFYKAWENLHAENIERTDEIPVVLKKIKQKLTDFEQQPYSDYTSRRISARAVMKFLRDKGTKGGRGYVGYDSEGESLRPTWKVFRNAFLAWLFHLERDSVQDYLEKAAKLEAVDDFYQYSWTKPSTSVISMVTHLLASPLVTIQEVAPASELEVWVDFEPEEVMPPADPNTIKKKGN